MEDKQINIQRNNSGRIILYDTDEVITAKIENFKESPAVLTVIEHIPGQWEMKKCNMEYERKDAETIQFEIELGAHAKKELEMRYNRRNVKPGDPAVIVR
jgi:hypothetical protein